MVYWACGFTNTDNLKRLQDSLQGLAKEAVQSRLLMPESVPDVIEDLRKLFGNPEKLLKSLVAKVQKAQAPRMDKLETFLYFGIAVKQLSDHLEAAGMHDHLSNPMLVQELVGKLPPEYKLDWVRFKRGKTETPLKSFSIFISEIVSEVSEVADFTVDSGDLIQSGRNKHKKREFIHTHDSQPNRSGGSQTEIYAKSKKPCVVCNRNDHKVRFCDDFAKLNIRGRLEIVEKFKLCQLCLNDHGKVQCTFRSRCNVPNCTKKHHSLLHRAEKSIQLSVVENNTHFQSRRSVIFRIVPVTLYVGGTAVDTSAFLDEGASVTLVEDNVAEQLNARGIPEPLVITWTANMKRHEETSRKINLQISARGSRTRHNLKEARTVNELVLPKQEVCLNEVLNRYNHFKGLSLPDYGEETPRILIGLDNLHLFAPLESKVGKFGEPIAVRSLLGWSIYGPDQHRSSAKTYVHHHLVRPVSNEELHDLLRKQYTLEDTCTQTEILPETDDIVRARRILEHTTRRLGDCFETGLIWKSENVALPDSYPMALKRMMALERRLSKDPQLQAAVHEQIESYQLKGYAHKATPAELANLEGLKVWYLPLNVVRNPKKPSKLRLVWDAAASVGGISLNSTLLKGPDLLTSLPAVISKFRERPVAIGGDIREMYHQLRIREADKQAQRFIFRFDPSEPPQVYIMDVATFGATCSPCSAQFIKNCNALEYAAQFPDTADAIVDRTYVDDYFDSLDTEEEALQRATEVRFVNSKAGFEVRNWSSNSLFVLKGLGEEKAAESVHFHLDKTTENERVLGVIWNPRYDVLSFAVPTGAVVSLDHPGIVTKRAVLSSVMTLFDPLGLLAPFTTLGKMLVQDLWRSGCEWDSEIDDESFKKWTSWISALPGIAELKIPRSYFGATQSKEFGPIQLHIFTDAGENAYGCAGFLRIEVDGVVKCSLAMARSKVSRLKQLTIPRLELQAAVMGARMPHVIKNNHSMKIQQTFIWTDSRTVLSWVTSDQKRYKQFVSFKIGEILTLTKLSEWKWIPSKMNIADCLTKWRSDSGLSPEWFSGPSFLYDTEDRWPHQPLPPANTQTELRAVYLFHDVILAERLIDETRFSKWKILVRVMACVIRFVSNCRRKLRGDSIEALKPTPNQQRQIITNIPSVKVPLKQSEYRQAEIVLFRSTQNHAYSDEIKILKKNQQIEPSQMIPLEKNSPLYKLTPLLDDEQVLRIEGRCDKADHLPFDMRFPIILPRNDTVTELLVRHYHESFGHAFRNTVKNEIKQRFYIFNLNSVVAKIEQSCNWCKVHKSQPKVPRMASLPVQRLTPYRRPFTFVGIDYLGPVEVSEGRRSEKRWIVLFTCLVVRAVHLEVAYNLTAQSCVMAIQRFISRWGPATEYFSDNGTNLKAASKEFVQQVREIDFECADEFTNARTKWHFNPPATPHMGGVWERMVRTVKSTLSALDDGRKLTDEILLTSLAKIGDMINSRPLVYAPQCALEEALSPNHFLRGIAANEPQEVQPPTNPGLALRDAYQRSVQLTNQAWERWIKEYVPSINRRNKWFDESTLLKKGDLVYVVDGNKRKTWIRGIIEEPIVSSDGRIRQAFVRTNHGVVKRATANLAILEITEGNAAPEDGS
ncbi:uncharacterized protein LOC128740709 [Sabethes cyaneus]|uniref:uncharacterized protein LOC128740709 n=1 Tax=Sabethes cyaneus TaxID=53552 RepID=UPI00237E75D1|nr:uncharacterized protein LOC128740709 [Sabethes cyaneus]